MSVLYFYFHHISLAFSHGKRHKSDQTHSIIDNVKMPKAVHCRVHWISLRNHNSYLSIMNSKFLIYKGIICFLKSGKGTYVHTDGVSTLTMASKAGSY